MKFKKRLILYKTVFYKLCEETKNILPVLAEADVVDSGASGYLYVAEGMYKSLCGEAISYEPLERKNESSVNIDLFTRNSVLEYGYCTEFLLRLTVSKVDPDSFDVAQVVSLLKEMGGDSIVAYKQDDIVKVHVHTFSPGEILAKMQSFGEFLTVKVENMNLGHSGEEKKKLTVEQLLNLFSQASGSNEANDKLLLS